MEQPSLQFGVIPKIDNQVFQIYTCLFIYLFIFFLRIYKSFEKNISLISLIHVIITRRIEIISNFILF